MHGPPVVSWLLTLMCAATGAYCLALGRRGVAGTRVTAGAEAVMGLGMAAMAVPGAGAVLPPEFFVCLFASLAGWSAWSALRPARGADGYHGHGLHHTVEALAMTYMAVVMLGAGGVAPGVARAGAPHSHHGAAEGIPALTGGLLLYLAVFALHTGARLLPAAAAGGPAPGARSAMRPAALADACRLTLALGSFTCCSPCDGEACVTSGGIPASGRASAHSL